MFALLGDSHIRSYKDSKYIAARIFLTQGRKNNFKNNINFLLTTFRYFNSASKLKKADLQLAFVIGEPDVRWLAYGDWYIKKGEEVFKSDLKILIDESCFKNIIRRVKAFLYITKVLNIGPSILIGSGTPNPELVLASSALNKKLKGICVQYNCLFFDPQLHALDDMENVKNNYIGYSVFNKKQMDFTHLSTLISEDFDNFVNINYTNDHFCMPDWREKVNFYNKFVEIKDFDTYKPADSLIRRVFNLTKRRLFV